MTEPEPARPGAIMVDQTKLIEFVHDCPHVGVGVRRTLVAPATGVSAPIARVAHPLVTVVGADEIGDDGFAALLSLRSSLGLEAYGCHLSVRHAGPVKRQCLIMLHGREVGVARAAGPVRCERHRMHGFTSGVGSLDGSARCIGAVPHADHPGRGVRLAPIIDIFRSKKAYIRGNLENFLAFLAFWSGSRARLGSFAGKPAST